MFIRILFASFMVTGLMGVSFGQGPPEGALLREMLEEERTVVDALALYPEDVLEAILEATLHPEALVRLKSIQEKSSARFEAILEGRSQRQQEGLWTVVRFPGLVDALVRRGKLDGEDLDEFLGDYPSEIHAVIRELNEEDFPALEQIQQINAATEQALYTALSVYPEQTRASFRKLETLPEVLELLQENLPLAVLVGEAYRRNPEKVRQRAAELRLEAARKNAESAEDWTRELEKSPEAREEFERSAKAFLDQEGYDAAQKPPAQTAVTVNLYSYPYWYGYPYWDPFWYPYPYWYHTGFYYRPGGTIVIIGVPSYHYTHWHFRHHHHHLAYPHLSDHFLRHYENHREAGSGLNQAVEAWTQEYGDVFDRQWLTADSGRVERIRDFGRLEQELSGRLGGRAPTDTDRKQFLQQNSNRFPSLSRSDSPSRRVDGTSPVTPARSPALERAGGFNQSDFFKERRAAEYHQQLWKRKGRSSGSPVRARPGRPRH